MRLSVRVIETLEDIQQTGPWPVRMVSFGLYQRGLLLAGEFGVVSGRVYTSYAGFHNTASAGKARLALTALYLQEQGFAFWDLGMPTAHKRNLGAREVGRGEFGEIHRAAAIPPSPGSSVSFPP
jgi:Leu/Phe-tRNA-protein transferase